MAYLQPPPIWKFQMQPTVLENKQTKRQSGATKNTNLGYMQEYHKTPNVYFCPLCSTKLLYFFHSYLDCDNSQFQSHQYRPKTSTFTDIENDCCSISFPSMTTFVSCKLFQESHMTRAKTSFLSNPHFFSNPILCDFENGAYFPTGHS